MVSGGSFWFTGVAPLDSFGRARARTKGGSMMETLLALVSRDGVPSLRKGEGRPHQPGQEAYVATLPEEIRWAPFAAFPPSVRLGVVVGQPAGAGPYTIRIKVPHGVRLMPHRHPEDRIYTVISGVFYIGLGEHFESDHLDAYPPGSVIVLPGDTFHFHWAKSGEYVTQATAVGRPGLEYGDSKEDPPLEIP